MQQHPLSRKQVEVLKALESFAKRKGYIPSVRELAAKLRKSPTTVFQHLKVLERKGYVKGDGKAHGWRVVLSASSPPKPEETPSGLVALPGEAPAVEAPGGIEVTVLGTIAAGVPIEAVEDRAETFVLPSEMVPKSAFALRVRGDSMIDDHILEGDLVIVRPQDSVSDGEIAVALLDDGSATLKRVFRENGRVRLQPANQAMDPIYVDSVQIQGKVVGVWRGCR